MNDGQASLARGWLAAYVSDPRMAARLTPLEREIWAGLAERPIRTWCTGCFALAYAIFGKASGRPIELAGAVSAAAMAHTAAQAREAESLAESLVEENDDDTK